MHPSLRRVVHAVSMLALLTATPLALAASVDTVNGARIAKAADPGEWLSYGRTYDEQRFSPLKQINTTTAKDLGLAWYADLGSTRGVEGTPLEVDGVLYNTQPWNIVSAYEAKTGKLLWRYDPKVPESTGRFACCDIDARGLAVWKGKIISATLDGRLIALDAKTGKPVWTVNTFDDGQKFAEVVTGAPRVFDGKVLIGNSGAEAAARGYVSAYDAETGKKLWRFYLVPGNPAERAAQPANQRGADAIAAPTWNGEWWKNGGGGDPWDSIVYDPKLKLIYIGGGNGGPWVQKYRSPGGGDNLFLSSIVAVHVDDGSYAWHYQENQADEWDYTATQPMILADLKIAGQLRHVLMQAPKNGFFYVLDRVTGKLISAKGYVPQNWTTGIDMKTGRPIETPQARYGVHPVLITPGAAHNWHPMAFNPETGLAYFPVNEGSRLVAVDPDFNLKPGDMSQLGTALTGYEDERKALSAIMRKTAKSYLIAYDPVKQKEVWRVPYKRGGNGGTLTTAGNLVFEGTSNGTFAAYNARTGETVWEAPVQQVPISGPIAYRVDGEDYIAVDAGFGGGLAHDGLNASGLEISDYGRLLVFKLGGTAKLPEFHYVKATLDPPPNIPHSNGEVIEGMTLFAKNCAVCHGENARGGIKDLRLMSSQTHKDFFDIVLGGKRAPNGMASFADKLSRHDVAMIQKYLIARIDEDWTDLKNGKL